MKITKKCETCEEVTQVKNYSHIIIDTDNNTLTCGIKGIIAGTNIRIIDNKIFCAKCGQTLYVEQN